MNTTYTRKLQNGQKHKNPITKKDNTCTKNSTITFRLPKKAKIPNTKLHYTCPKYVLNNQLIQCYKLSSNKIPYSSKQLQQIETSGV